MLVSYDHTTHALPLCPSDVDHARWRETGARRKPEISGIVPLALQDRLIRVVVFCGGRGSASIVRELIRWPQVDLSLLVNAYDDGLSTGQLREFIPNMLGPSDFRKNLSHILDLCSDQQYALRQILEFRLPRDFSATHFESLIRFLSRRSTTSVMPRLEELFDEVDHLRKKQIVRYLEAFLAYYLSQDGRGLTFADCSFGNLIFAGCYLECGRSFNSTVKRLSGLFGSKANLINVSRGENRILAALKEDGQILAREADIVGAQSRSPIQDIFFLERPLTDVEKDWLAALPIAEKAATLSRLSRDVALSSEAEEALLAADLVIYGPGTQFSSLLPSYRIARDAIRRSPAAVKVLVANLDPDHDIQALSALDLADKAFEMLGDPSNQNRAITHILLNHDGVRGRMPLNGSGRVPGTYKSAHVVIGEFANPSKPTVHSGYQVVRSAFALHRTATARRQTKTLDIYVDLLDRSMATDFLIQEFMELPWGDGFAQVRLRVNRLRRPAGELPPHLQVEAAECSGLFSDVEVLQHWLERDDSDYLVTLTGDGEYRLSDLLFGIQVCEGGVFGAVFGSRTQSRRQFRSSLRAAYGEKGILYGISWLGAFIFTAVFGLRFGVVLSDPLTGFRIYQRRKMNTGFRSAIRQAHTAAGITRLMIANQIEIAEIPVSYRTFDSFTKPAWRLWRGLRNLLGAVA